MKAGRRSIREIERGVGCGMRKNKYVIWRILCMGGVMEKWLLRRKMDRKVFKNGDIIRW